MSRLSGVEPGPPSKALLVAEPFRALGNAAALAGARHGLKRLPRGDGRPVLLLPGLVNGDGSLFALHRYLVALGYRPYRWELGRNLGVRAIGGDGARLFARLEAVAAQSGAPVTLIGFSLGGIMARIAAHRAPDLVREVITVSAPFAGPPKASNVWRMFERLTGEKVTDASVIARREEAALPLAMPATAIWSASDGFVAGESCYEARNGERSIEVRSSHAWVQMNPQVLRAIALVLAGNSLTA